MFLQINELGCHFLYSIMVKDKTKNSWDINTTKLFVDLCLEQVLKSRRKGTSFKKDGWENMDKRFTESYGYI